jgi:predicted transcriptional regulator
MSESSQEDNNRGELLGLTSEIVAAHVSNNTVAVGDLPDLIERVYKSLASVGAEQEPTCRTRETVGYAGLYHLS